MMRPMYGDKIPTNVAADERYLTAKRVESMTVYLAAVASGEDTVSAWNRHKARMQDLGDYV
jgi:hypothetical protein